MSNTNVLFHTLVDPSGSSGQNKYSKEVAASLGRHEKINLHLLTPEPANDIPSELANVCCSIRHIDQKRSGSLVWHTTTKPTVLYKISELYKSERIDLVVTPLKVSNISPVIMSNILNIQQVLIVEGMLKNSIKKQDPFPGAVELTNAVAFLNSYNSSHIFTAYDEAKRWIQSFPYVSEEKVETFNHGVDTELFSPHRESTTISNITESNPDTIVGYVGSFKKYHELTTLVNAINCLKTIEQDIHLLLIGDGPEREVIEQQVNKLDLGGSVTFTGHIEHSEVCNYINACDIMYGVIDPGHWGSPMKVYEYLSCGLPVITYNSEEFEFINKKGIGETINTIKSEEVSQAIRKLSMYGESERLEVEKSAREYIVNNRTWDHLASKIHNCVVK